MKAKGESASAPHGGLMQPHLIEDLAYKESFYWWHRVRRYRLFQLIEGEVGQPQRVLEIGCGTGANLRDGEGRWATGFGMDLDLWALIHCRDLAVIRSDAEARLPFSSERFDVVFMLDVLEHLATPEPLISEIGRVLRPRGAVVIMVPADPRLWSYWDEMHGHQRRYTRASLASVCETGFELRTVQFIFSWMYPAVWAYRRIMQRRSRSASHSDFVELPRPLNWLQIMLGRAETAVERVFRVPFGTTLCGVWLKDGEQ